MAKRTPKPKQRRQRAARPTALVPQVERWTPAASPPSPFTLMRRFAEEMDRLFEDLRLGSSSLLPRLEVTERGGKLVVRADLPGLTKDDVKVEVREDNLCIAGERRQEREEKRKGFYRSERSYGRFYREVPLPEGVDASRRRPHSRT